jgi:hypothetical protein
LRSKDNQVKAVCEALKERGAIDDFRYDHFKQSEAIPPPFAVYRRVAQPNMSADGVVYHHGEGVDLELYTETPEDMADLMDQVEELLDAQELFYNLTADTVYIEPEDFYESLYEI